MENNSLQHHGVKGMKWGVRKKNYVTVRQGFKNARKAGEDARRAKIRELNESPKKHTLRQYNIEAGKARKAAMKESIAKDKAYNREQREKNKPQMSEDAKEAAGLKKKKVSEMSTAELKRLNKRLEAENNYRRLNPGKVVKGMAVAGTVAAGLGTVLLLKRNATTVINEIGRPAANKIMDSVGNTNISDLFKSHNYIDL